MKKRLPKAQKGAAKIVKSVAKKVKPVTKAVKKPSRATNAFEREIEAAISSLERAKLKKQFSALDSKIKKKEGSLKPKKMQKGGPIGSKKIVRKKAISKKPPKKLISRDPSKKIKEALGKAQYRKPIARKPKMQKGGTIKKATKSIMKMMEGRTGTKTPTKSKVRKMAKKGKLGTGLAKAQKGGATIGKLTRKTKKYLKKVKDTNPLTPPGTAKSKTRSGGKTVTSRSGLTHRVNRRGAPKKNQGGGRPMSAKKAIRKMKRRG